MEKGNVKLVLLVVAVLIIGLLMVYAAPRAAKACRDGFDNDGDGFTDFPDDPGCSTKNDTSELNPAIECDDGVDNGDADSLVDYSDPGCSGPTDNDETDGQCDDLSDNDGDTHTDYPSDPGCTGYSDSSELGTVQCDDGVDNDGDVYIDYPNDPQCSSASDDDEFPPNMTCNDSDFGITPGVFGTVSGYDNGSPYELDDYCDGANPTHVIEYYCWGNPYDSVSIDCDLNEFTTCSAGRCI